MSEENENPEEEEVIETPEGKEEEHEEPEEIEEEEEPEDEEEEESSAAPEEKPKSRASDRVAKLVKERNEEREKRIRAETLAEERAVARHSPADHSAAQRLREEKLSLMDPAEKREFLKDEKIQTMEQQILFTQLQTQDMLDKSRYEGKAERNTVFARHADEVEKRLSSERKAGRNWNREQILAQIVGEAALKTKPDAKKKDEAKERVNSAKSTPVSGRSNSSAYKPGRKDESLEDMERRLGGVSF